MRLKKMHWFGIVGGILVLIVGLVFFIINKDVTLLLFLIGISTIVLVLPFVADIILSNKRNEQMSVMFLEFARNLSESVSTGTPVSRSIVNMKNKSFGPLTPHVYKLANQIELGIPVSHAMENFAFEIDNQVISRAVTLISEAERAGGQIDYILKSVAESISEVEILKKERKAAIYNLVVQAYIVFFIFIVILLVMEFRILPLTEGIGGLGILSGDITNIENASLQEGSASTPEELARPFLMLLVTQGIFTGLTVGKLTEGTVKAGVKHSFILSISAFMISVGARLFIG